MATLPTSTARFSRLLPVLLAVFTLLAVVGDTGHIRWLHYAAKPLIMGTLLWYSCCYVPVGTGGGWFRAGMGLALLGDGLLMIQEMDLFAFGLGAFLLMQMCYGLNFWQLPNRQPTRWVRALPFGLYVGVLLSLLYPAVVPHPARQALWWPIVIYALALGTMGFLAAQPRTDPRAHWLLAGALLFILSDSAIAINRFLLPIPGAPWLIMGTYALAQYLLVLGVLAYWRPKERYRSPSGT